MLGAGAGTWLYAALRQSSRAGVGWRLIGQQVLLAPFVPQVGSAPEIDSWEGYPAARGRLFDCIEHNGVADVAILSGDIHSSWALDVPRSPLSGYDETTGRGSLGHGAGDAGGDVCRRSSSASGAPRARPATFRTPSPHLKYSTATAMAT